MFFAVVVLCKALPCLAVELSNTNILESRLANKKFKTNIFGGTGLVLFLDDQYFIILLLLWRFGSLQVLQSSTCLVFETEMANKNYAVCRPRVFEELNYIQYQQKLGSLLTNCFYGTPLYSITK